MEKIIKDLRILKAIGFKEGLIFDRKFKYYVGNTYLNFFGEYLKSYYIYKNKKYTLKFYDGCFNPFLVEVLKNG